MRKFVAVMSKDVNGHVAKSARFATQQEADAHVAKFIGEFPDAFVVFDPPSVGTNLVVDFVAKTITHDQAQTDADALERSWDRLRSERNALLVSSDWTQASDSPLTDEVQASWATYRGELRDLPASTEDPDDPTWPTPPE
jgi:hypothetical protein